MNASAPSPNPQPEALAPEVAATSTLNTQATTADLQQFSAENLRTMVTDDPEKFRNLSAPFFLNLDTELLHELFINPTDQTVDFHGNTAAQRAVGLGDLFGWGVDTLLVDGKKVYRSFKGTKVGYLDTNGNYVAVWGGEKVLPSTAEQADPTEKKEFYDDYQRLSNPQEQVLKSKFLEDAEKTTAQSATLWADIDALAPHATTPSQAFVEALKVEAQALEKRSGIPWPVTVVQACLESGFGQSSIGANIFGLKSRSGEDSITSWTTEQFSAEELADWKKSNAAMADQVQSLGGDYYLLPDQFLDIKDLMQAVEKYGERLKLDRYQGAFSSDPNQTPAEFLSAIIAAGYATDPNYNQKAASIARTWNLPWDTASY